ncbi:MAG: discoidin domain-containing protein [Verrucomicrobiales bacterium]|nr:discoidin domain-containing protein [Verrucomicrobiales bacterium]
MKFPPLAIAALALARIGATSLAAVEEAGPNAVEFPPQQAKFVRVVVRETSGGEACLDELEVYGSDAQRNLALAAHGAKATASSCLAGYAIHQVAHLNDGGYGNRHSWIASGPGPEWAQIELERTTAVSKVVFSRDRESRYHDRVPTAFEVQLSADGRQWTTVRRMGHWLALPADATWEERMRYAFLGEQASWGTIDSADPVTRVLRQFEEMLTRFSARGIDVSVERTELARLCRGQSQVAAADDTAKEAAYLEVRLAKRRLFLRDPDLAPLSRILFVARHPYEPSHNYSDILDAQWRPGGGVRVLEIPRRDGRLDPASATVTTLFDARDGVARDAMAGFDARTIYFAHRSSPEGYFHLFSVNADGGGVRQITDRLFHDFYPCPLPDGGLTFISTRCKARFLCWRPQAFVLFRMDAEGGNIRPLSFANLSEWAPSVMRDGRILWTRSEYLDKGADFGHTLWAIRPDGTHPELVFGNNTRYCYMNGREVPGSGELCATLISHGGDLNGPIALIAPDLSRSNPEAVTNITPDSKPHFNMNWARQQCFRDPVPIARDYFLVSHAPHQHFGLYVIDRWGNRELLHLDPTISSVCPTPLQPVPAPPHLASGPPPPAADEGEFIVEDVYAGLGAAVPRGSVRHLRVCQEVRADLEKLATGEYRKDHPPFESFYASPTDRVRGPNGWPTYVAKAALGLVPVEADGSVRFDAPAGKVLYFQLLDENLNEVQRMRSVVQLQPGERRSCIGCHEQRAAATPVASTLAMRHPPRRIEPPSWGAAPFDYAKVVQPVWDAQCVRCHDRRDARKFDLTGTLDADRVPASYHTLITQGWVHYFDMAWSLPHHKAEPLTFGTVKSRLWPVLDRGHHGVVLTRDQMHRVKCWIDLNCPLWPDYLQRELRPESAQQTADNQ